MKNTLKVLIALTLFMSSCSRVEDKRIKITYQTMETLPEQRKALEKLVAEFEAKNPNIKIEVLTSTISFQKLSIQIAGGDVPDVFYYVTDRLPGIAGKDILLDLTSFVNEIDLRQYFEKAITSCQIKGKFYCFPYHFSTDILFYNKDLFDKEAMGYPNEEWTWNDFVNAAQKLTKRENGRIIQYGTLQPRPLLVIKSFGGECFDENITRCIIDSPETKEAVQFIIDLDKKYNAAPSTVTIKDMERMDGVDMFSAGRVAMLMGRTFMLSEFRKLKKFNWDIAPVPLGKRRYSRLAVGVMCISKSTKYPRESWEFVKFLCGKEGSYLTGMAGNCVPAFKEAAYSKEFLMPPPENAKLFVDSIGYSQSDNPGISIWEEFYQRIVQDNIDKILCGIISIEEGLKKMDKEGTELLGKSK